MSLCLQYLFIVWFNSSTFWLKYKNVKLQTHMYLEKRNILITFQIFFFIFNTKQKRSRTFLKGYSNSEFEITWRNVLNSVKLKSIALSSTLHESFTHTWSGNFLLWSSEHTDSLNYENIDTFDCVVPKISHIFIWSSIPKNIFLKPIYLKRTSTEKMVETLKVKERELFSADFTPQIVATTTSGPGWSQESRTPNWFWRRW